MPFPSPLSLIHIWEMFHARLEEVEKQIEALQATKNMLKYKCWYYDTAIEAGTEETVKNMLPEEIPENVRDYKI